MHCWISTVRTVPTGPLCFSRLFFPSAQSRRCVDKLYSGPWPRSAPVVGMSIPRKHIVHTTSLLWRFSSLQVRSKSVHVPCNRARSGNNPRKSPRPSISRPAPLTIYLFCPHPLPMSNRGRFAFPTYFFIFCLCSLGPIGLYHGFVITFCSPISYLYITLSSTGCCQAVVVLDAQSSIRSRSLHTN